MNTPLQIKTCNICKKVLDDIEDVNHYEIYHRAELIDKDKYAYLDQQDVSTVSQIDCHKDDQGDINLRFVYDDPIPGVPKSFDVLVMRHDRGAFFNMLAQIYQQYQNAENNSYVTVHDFSVTLPSRTQTQGRQKLMPYRERREFGGD